jgi:hypothetical protein
MPIQAKTHTYGFQPAGYHIDATGIIARRDGPAGAHSDIPHAEVAHVQWQAALSALRSGPGCLRCPMHDNEGTPDR